FIHIRDWGPMVLGKTCRYCTPCELIMAHQDEFEDQLAHYFASIAPEVIGNEYMVLGTMTTNVWRRGLEGGGNLLDEMLKHVADFKKIFDLKVEGGGWQPA